MKKSKFLSVIAVGALLLGTGLTSCQQEPELVEVHYYGVSIITSKGGKITSSKDIAKVGEEVTLTISPEANHSLTSLKLNGTEKVTEVKDNKLTVTMSEGALKVEGLFTETTYKVNIAETANGSVTSSIQEGKSGDKVTLTVVANTGFELDTFTVDGADKKAELVNGTFETTIANADITVAATFKGLEADALIADFVARTAKASELEVSGIVNKAKYINVSSMTTETTYEKFTNADEGDYSVVTEIRKKASGELTSKKVDKTTLKEGTLYKISQNFAPKKVNGETTQEFDTKSTSTDLSSAAGTSIELNGGKGYLGDQLFGGYAGKFTETKLKGAQHLKITFEGATTKVSYDALATDWTGVETYTLTEGTFVFDGEKITSAIEKISTYTSGFTKDDAGNVTLEEGAKAKVQSKEFTFDYGEAKAELPEFATLRFGALATTTITPSYFEIVNYTQEQKINDLSNLQKAHSYKVKLAAEENKVFDPLTLEVIPDYGQDSANINASYSSWSHEITIESTGTFTGKLSLKTFNVKLDIPVTIVEPTVESIELGVPNYKPDGTSALDKTASLKVGESIQLGLNVNPLGANDKVAFTVTGTGAEGCKVVSEDMYGQTAYTFTAGQTTGEVKVQAISTVDSSIVSNELVVTISEGGTLPGDSLFNQLPGSYQTGDSDMHWLSTPLTLGELQPDPEGGFAGTYSGAGTSGGTYFFSEDGMGAMISFGGGAHLQIQINGATHTYVVYMLDVALDEATGTVALSTDMISPENEGAPELTNLTLYKII